MKAAIVFIGINLLISNSLGQSINCDWFEYSTGKDAYCSSIDIDNEGNIYTLIEGSPFEQTEFEYLSEKGILIIAKYNTFGKIKWLKKSQGGFSYLYSKPLTVNDNGDIYYTGSFFDTISFLDTTYISRGYWYYNLEIPDSFYVRTTDYFVAKIDSKGYEKWIQVIGNWGDERGVHSTTNGTSIFVVGNFTDTFSIDLNSNLIGGGKFLLKYDTLGSLHKYRHINSSYRIDNMVCNNYNILITGIRDGDIFIDKFDLELNLIQSIQFGGENNDYGHSLAISSDRTIILGGNFSSKNIKIGNLLIENSNSGFNLFLTKLDNELVSAHSISDNTILYPNPVIDKATISYMLLNNSNVDISIFDILGNKVLDIIENHEMQKGLNNIEFSTNQKQDKKK